MTRLQAQKSVDRTKAAPSIAQAELGRVRAAAELAALAAFRTALPHQAPSASWAVQPAPVSAPRATPSASRPATQTCRLPLPP
jgi:hypothetical protein